MLWDFLMNQVLMTIDTGCPLRLHFLMRRLGRRPWRLRILVASPARHAVPALQFHTGPVGCLRASLVELFNRRVVDGEFLYQERHSIHHMRPHSQMEVGQALRNVTVL